MTSSPWDADQTGRMGKYGRPYVEDKYECVEFGQKLEHWAQVKDARKSSQELPPKMLKSTRVSGLCTGTPLGTTMQVRMGQHHPSRPQGI